MRGHKIATTCQVVALSYEYVRLLIQIYLTTSAVR